MEITGKILADKSGFTITNAFAIKKYIKISAPGIYRAGLELNGFIPKKQKNVIVWGTKEQNWFDQNKENKKCEEAFKNIIKFRPPIIFLSLGIKNKLKNLILKCANKNGVPIIVSKLHVTEIIAIISPEILLAFSQRNLIHASLVTIDGVGVMITGKSGIGKSEVVLELIQDGYNFVSDDTVWLKRIGSKFIGKAAEITKGFLEVRGIGLINVIKVYGTKIMREYSYVDLVLELVDDTIESGNFDRLGNLDLKYKILGCSIPKMKLPVKYGKSIKSLVVAAVSTFVSNRDNEKTPLEEIGQRMER